MIFKFQSLLYFTYRVTSSITRFFADRVTPLGVIIVLLIPLVLIVFVTYYRLTTLYFLSLLCGILVFSIITVFFKSAKLVLTRELPEFASVGKDLIYAVSCKNDGSKSIIGAMIHDLTADSRPTKDEFIYTREPQEELRNIFDRVFAYYRWLWLCKNKTNFDSELTLLPVIKSSQELEFSLQCIPARRGRLEFSNARLCLPDPLYLLQKFVRVRCSTDSVLVLPKRYKLPDFMLEGAAKNHTGGLSHSLMAGVSDDFKGLRSYRSGDSIKHLDWAAWARTGSPVIREYENVFFPRYGLVLDTNGTYENVDNFEEAISIAASFSRVVDTQECLLDLIFFNKDSQTLTVGAGVARSENLLEHLATLEIEIQPDWQSLSQQVIKHSSSFSVCVVIFTRLSDERRKLVRDWKRAGLNLLVLILVNEEESKQAAIAIGAIPIDANHVQRDLLNML